MVEIQIWNVEEEWRAGKFNESQSSFGMGAESGFVRGAEREKQREKEQ